MRGFDAVSHLGSARDYRDVQLAVKDAHSAIGDAVVDDDHHDDDGDDDDDDDGRWRWHLVTMVMHQKEIEGCGRESQGDAHVNL